MHKFLSKNYIPKKIRLIIIIILFAIFILLLKQVFPKEQKAYTQNDFFFDTYVSITLYDYTRNERAVNNRLNQCIDICKKYENMFSRTKEGSDIYNINHSNGEWTKVSNETISLIHTALSYCDYTDGLVDITITPAKELWDFSKESDKKLPKEEELYRALTHVSYKNIEIKGNRIRLNDPDSAIDLGFIAKGYIADQLKAYLLSENQDNAIINLGGNIQTIGNRSDHTPFRIGIQKPFAQLGTFEYIVNAGEQDNLYTSVVTSGIYERYFQKNDIIYHHILNAKTGMPIQNNLLSVTILSNSSVDADALSTTCLLLGLEKGKELIESMSDTEAIFITDQFEIIDTRK